MKLLVTCLVLWLTASAYGQELVSKDGLTISYEASKVETTKKFDKWSIKLTIKNTTDGELYFTAPPSSAPSLTLDAQYARIDIPNAKGLLSLDVKFLHGKLAEGVLTPDKRGVYKIQAGTWVEEFTTRVAINDVPTVKGTIMATLKSLNDITGKSTTPAPTQPTVTPAATTTASAPATGNQSNITVLPRASLAAGMKLLLNQAIAMPAYPENRLVLENNGNLVLYDDGGKNPLWSSNTGGKQVSYGEMQDDGNFVLKTAAGAAVWSTETGGNPGAMIVLGQGGTVGVFTKDFKSLWTAP